MQTAGVDPCIKIKEVPLKINLKHSVSRLYTIYYWLNEHYQFRNNVEFRFDVRIACYVLKV